MQTMLRLPRNLHIAWHRTPVCMSSQCYTQLLQAAKVLVPSGIEPLTLALPLTANGIDILAPRSNQLS